MNTFENKKNIVIVAHKFVTHPDDDLVIFLNLKQYSNILHIRHSFSDAPDRCSYYTWYKKGVIFKEYRTEDYKKWPHIFIYLKEFYFNAQWILQTKIKWDLYIGMDGLCVLFGNALRFFRQVKKTVYWAIDFVPEGRFNNWIKNQIYHRVNIWGYKNSDEMWDLSPVMAGARKECLGIQPSDYKLNKVVPYGVWIDRIKKYSYEECEKSTMVFMGHLMEKQGVQLVLQVIPDIVRVMPNFMFKIIGGGEYKDALINRAKKLGVLQYCDFRGKLVGIQQLEEEIAKSCVAIAPYIRSIDRWTKYADPGKIKTYLACGVPVLLTDIPWNSREIEGAECGKIITEDKNDLVKNILELLMDGQENQYFRDNALRYAQKFNYQNIFSDLNL